MHYIYTMNYRKFPSILKHSSGDPFTTTVTQSQSFEINPNKNNTIEGKEGTIIVFPQNCFIDAEGQTVKKMSK
ncbi:MAG: hypothetical protein ACI94Y_001929 [Maribacter sp.]|jgi:hypothetical protein